MTTILITGGSRGIGRAAARACAARGWDVAVNYVRDEAAADAAVAEVRAAGVRAVSVRGDVAMEADVIAMFDEAERALGKLDGVVVNAGIVASPSSLAEMSAERLQRTFAVNVLGTFFCAREAARRMPLDRGGRGGSIVLLSSAAARIGSPFEYVDYASSKGAVDTLVLGLAKELGRQGVRVNAVRPGLIDTEIHASGGQPDRLEKLAKTNPMGRIGTAEEVAEAIVWLLSDASSYTTASIVDVAGGR